jgi:hypothetical protein
MASIERSEVYESTVIDSPIEQVWEAIRDFDGLPRWHPMIETSQIEEAKQSDAVGAVRNFVLAGGGRIRERLVCLSDADYTLKYTILEAPIAVERYMAMMQLYRVTDGNRAFVLWSAAFDAPAESKLESANLVSRIFRAGFQGLKTYLNGE